MDGCSWLLQDGGGGDIRGGYTASCGGAGAGLHHKGEEEEVIGSQAMQEKLNQIYMLLDMEEDEYAVPAPPPRRASLPSSSSSSFRSFSGSRDDNSPSLMLTAASTTTSCDHHHHQPEVSSQLPVSPVAYAAVHHQQSRSSSLDLPALDSMYYQEPYQEQARCSRTVDHGTATANACAFRPYARCLGPTKKLKPGAGGQRAMKTAMSILARMHMAKLAQCYQMESMAAQAPPPPPRAGTICNQLQHVLSERKRREKLNDSFKALRSVLPPVSKRDKTSILITAKDYVNTLKARVSELEEKNRMLVESELHCGNGRQDNDSGETIEVDISRTAAEGPFECQEFHLKIVLRSECSVMDAVAGILRCLKEGGDISLVAMNTDSFPRSTVTLKLKSSSCDEELLKESVIKAVKDVMQSDKRTP